MSCCCSVAAAAAAAGAAAAAAAAAGANMIRGPYADYALVLLSKFRGELLDSYIQLEDLS